VDGAASVPTVIVVSLIRATGAVTGAVTRAGAISGERRIPMEAFAIIFGASGFTAGLTVTGFSAAGCRRPASGLVSGVLAAARFGR
jgi:hypothetical protein